MVMMAFLAGVAAPWLMGILCDRGLSMSSVFAGYSLVYVFGGLAVGLGLLVFTTARPNCRGDVHQ